MKKILLSLTVFLTLTLGAQDPILISPKVGTEIDLAEKKQYRLFPYYSSQRFVSSSIYLMPDSTLQLRTKMTGDSVVNKPFSKQELSFLRSMLGEQTPAKTNNELKQTQESTGEKDIYFTVGLGYALPAANNSPMTERSVTSSGSSTTYDYKIKPRTGTLGTGISAGITLGYRNSKNLAFELNASYLRGNKLTGSYSSSGSGYTSKGSDEAHYSGVRFAPSFKFILPRQRTDLYIRAGVVVSLKNKLIYTSDYMDSDPWSSNHYYQVTSYGGRLAFGYTGGIGFNYRLSRTTAFFAEASFIALSWAPKHSEITESLANGVDQLPLMTINDKETDYLKSYSYTATTGISNATSPDKQLKFYLPLSSVGLNIGLHISLGKK